MTPETYERMNRQADRDAANYAKASIEAEARRVFPEIFERANRVLRAYESAPLHLRNRDWMSAAQDGIHWAYRSIRRSKSGI